MQAESAIENYEDRILEKVQFRFVNPDSFLVQLPKGCDLSAVAQAVRTKLYDKYRSTKKIPLCDLSAKSQYRSINEMKSDDIFIFFHAEQMHDSWREIFYNSIKHAERRVLLFAHPDLISKLDLGGQNAIGGLSGSARMFTALSSALAGRRGLGSLLRFIAHYIALGQKSKPNRYFKEIITID